VTDPFLSGKFSRNLLGGWVLVSLGKLEGSFESGRKGMIYTYSRDMAGDFLMAEIWPLGRRHSYGIYGR
jgi:hypothetical protein